MGPLTQHLRRYGFLWLLFAAYVAYQGWPRWAAWMGADPRRAPAFEVTDLNGHTIDSRSLAGKVVLVNFWATWCPPCRVEMPGFEAVYRRHRDDGFEVLAVALDGGNRRAVERMVRELELTFPVVPDAGRLTREFGAADIVPTSILIDRRGRIREEVNGLFRETVLRTKVQRLLQEPPA